MTQVISNVDAEVAIFTVCNLAYLPRALVLAASLARYSGLRLNVVVFDKKVHLDLGDQNAELLWLEDLAVPRVLELAFMYDIIEFSTCLKPFIALKLLRSHQQVVFLDPDTCLFAALDPILADLKAYPIVLTPHYTTPQPRLASESDLGMMRFGSFNLGFFAVDNSAEGIRFLEWWSARCLDFCFMESQFGLSTDQKWVSIAPCFFPGIYISFNLGYNVAPWNTFERSLSKDAAGKYAVNGKFPLIFFHFSNFDVKDLEYLNKRASSETAIRYPVLLELSTFYEASLSNITEKLGAFTYAFDFMSDRSYISPTLRRAYAAIRDELPKGHDPFDADGPVGKFARKNALLTKKAIRYSYPQLSEARKYQRTFALIYWLMRVLLKVIGPNRFYDLSKLMVVLSIYRKNRGMWKL